MDKLSHPNEIIRDVLEKEKPGALSVLAMWRIVNALKAAGYAITPAAPAAPPEEARTHSLGVLQSIDYAMGVIEMAAGTLKMPAHEGGRPDSPLLPQLHHAYNSLKAARDFPDLAGVEAQGNPGTGGGV